MLMKFYKWVPVLSVLTVISVQPLGTFRNCCDLTSWDQTSTHQDAPQGLDIPNRSALSLSGSEFVSKYLSSSQDEREQTIFSEVFSGNVPDFMRNMVSIGVNATMDSTEYHLNYFVTPDYLSIGSDADYFLVPLSPISAQIIADSLGAMLPTRVMVDQIWATSKLKVEPIPIAPSDSMTSLSVMRAHDRMVREQRSGYLTEFPLGTLVAGHKKDVILSNKIYDHPSAPQVVIYGWHRTDGSPIQPVYNGHAEWYADYSHGIRLVSGYAQLNGNPVDLLNLLCDENLHKLISDEGPICTAYPENLE